MDLAALGFTVLVESHNLEHGEAAVKESERMLVPSSST
jgi:hypothetical protein